jgi:HEPN domain-containing protein
LAGEWFDKAYKTLEAAELLLDKGFPAESISLSYRAMTFAVRGMLSAKDIEGVGDDELPSLYTEVVLPDLAVSIENQRAFTIVRNLWVRVDVTGEEAGDPDTALACLQDASDFVKELRGLA